MAIRIALISANRHKDPYPVYPLGTAYLKGYLQTRLPDSEIVVWDMNLLTDEELVEHLERFSPFLVCLSLRNVDGANSLDRRGFIGGYKEIMGQIRCATKAAVVIGGAAFSIYPELFMRELDADYGIRGEGEQLMYELIDSLHSGKPHLVHPRLYTKAAMSGRMGGTEARAAETFFSVDKRECEELPTVKGVCQNSGLDIQAKTKQSTDRYIQSPCAVYESNLVEHYWKQSGMLNIQTKRGCPYHCIYCTYPQIDGCKVRTIQVESIVETMAKAKRDYGADYWFFTDSVFNLKRSFNLELAEALIREDLQISWGAYFSPSNLSDEELALYKRAGLSHIEFGTESFCDETLEAYGKQFTFREVVRCSELALKNNIFYSHFLILAGWGEDKKQLTTTIENSKQLRHTVIFPYVGMRIYPKTLLHQKAIQEGVIDKEDELLEPAYYITEGFDLEATKRMAQASGKAWIFPDAPQEALVQTLKLKRNKKGPLWEYLRKP
ncbi:MAG: B12-binding domain-containing radical SAM protein [Phocaeicola sp.]